MMEFLQLPVLDFSSMLRADLAELTAFITIAEQRSFAARPA